METEKSIINKEENLMFALCINADFCGSVRMPYGWEVLHRLNVMALKKVIEFRHQAVCNQCSPKPPVVAEASTAA